MCRNVGSRWALEKAKYNLVNEYLLVGVTEELEDFIMILEAALPNIFKGATELYRTGSTTVQITSQHSLCSPIHQHYPSVGQNWQAHYSVSCYSRKEVPSAKDHWEEASHQRDNSQAAAVEHLENWKWVLWVCTRTVSVCACPRCQGERRRTLCPGPELLLWKDLPKVNWTCSQTIMTRAEEAETLIKSHRHWDTKRDTKRYRLMLDLFFL